MSRYQPVRVAGDELVHYAAVDTERTIACEQVVVGEWPVINDQVPIELPRCGSCSFEWLVATGQVRLVRRMRTIMPPELVASRPPVEK